MGLINVTQINADQLSAFVRQASSGSAFSGNFINLVSNGIYMGPNVVWTSGGTQDISGQKRFVSSPIIPYSGSTGTAPSARWVNDQISTSAASLASSIADTGAALSKVRVTGGNTIQDANFSGIGGTQVIHSGDCVLISGGAGGGGGAGDSNVLVTGSSTISSANLTGVGGVVITYDGTYIRVSGAVGADSTLSGYVENFFVNRYSDQSVTGVKTFVSSPLVPVATIGTQAVNLGQLSGTSGILHVEITGASGYLFQQMLVMSGTLTGNMTGAFIGPSGVPGPSGAVGPSGAIGPIGPSGEMGPSGAIGPSGATGPTGAVGSIMISGITGNFVNMSFFFDQFNLTTGLNLLEGFVSRDFFFTGYALGAYNSGTQGLISGSIYQRNTINVKTELTNFVFNSGTFFYASGGFSQVASGMNRIGVDILRIGTGVTGFSVGVFGVGY
jgi:hypothetical protein